MCMGTCINYILGTVVHSANMGTPLSFVDKQLFAAR